MKERMEASRPRPVEVFLSGAYGRIRRITTVLAVMTTVVATLIWGWRCGLGSAIGSLAGYVNLVWLHHGSEIMIERMIAAPGSAPSRFRMMLAFSGRYLFLIVLAYAMLKGFPSMRFGFITALFLPILAAMCEGVYEAVANSHLAPPKT